MFYEEIKEGVEGAWLEHLKSLAKTDISLRGLSDSELLSMKKNERISFVNEEVQRIYEVLPDDFKEYVENERRKRKEENEEDPEEVQQA